MKGYNMRQVVYSLLFFAVVATAGFSYAVHNKVKNKFGIQENGTVALLVVQDDCNPCDSMKSRLKLMKLEYPGIKLEVVSLDDFPHLREVMPTETMPVLFMIKDKKILLGVKGVGTMKQIREVYNAAKQAPGGST